MRGPRGLAGADASSGQFWRCRHALMHSTRNECSLPHPLHGLPRLRALLFFIILITVKRNRHALVGAIAVVRGRLVRCHAEHALQRTLGLQSAIERNAVQIQRTIEFEMSDASVPPGRPTPCPSQLPPQASWASFPSPPISVLQRTATRQRREGSTCQLVRASGVCVGEKVLVGGGCVHGFEGDVEGMFAISM